MDLGNVTLNNGEVVLIKSDHDFFELVGKYISKDIQYEAENTFENCKELSETIEYLEETLEEIEWMIDNDDNSWTNHEDVGYIKSQIDQYNKFKKKG